MKTLTEKAYFAAGCFWGVQAAFDGVKGVISTRAGYMGGETKNPTYEEVCTGRTNHAEAVEVVFDPKQISFEKLLELFWKIHDPTQMNRQGPDIGTQYRSAIFFTTAEQKKAADKSKQLQGSKFRMIATAVLPAPVFYEAEEYHKKYYLTHGKVC